MSSPALFESNMKLKFILFICIICLLISSGCRPAANSSANANAVSVTDSDDKTVTINDSSRIVSIGTATTETIYALGAGDKVIAVDNSSREYIPESKNLPTVGARNSLSVEGILSLKPTLVILGADSAPPQIFDQLRNAGIAVLTIFRRISRRSRKRL